MRAALLLAAALAAAPSKPRPDAGADAPTQPVLAPPRAPHAAAGQTPCAACHAATSWTDVRFNHDRTGFPLTGAHVGASCRGCHPSDFDRPVPTTCSGCHRDVHSGDLGARCEGCHDGASWASRFDADAHRRTAFPLVGAHAAIPCTECHAQAAGRRFARPAVECTACHQADLNRTRGTPVDHTALGLTSTCRNCHNAFRFKPALFPSHDRCYLISSGSHAQVPCLGCHVSLSGITTTPGACATRTAACTVCHLQLTVSAAGARATEPLHQPPQVPMPVPGYAFVDRKCYQCHKQVAP